MTNDIRVILGLMVQGPDPKLGARMTELDDTKKALDIFQERGYKELDTARIYVGGLQEGWTRQAGWKERGLSIATKVFAAPLGMHKPDKFTESFETSLKELGTDSVDILYLHAPDRSVPFAETLEAADKLHKAGKFKQLGLSNFAAFEVAEVVLTCANNGWVRPTIYQAHYNCLARSIEDDLIPACRRYGLQVVIYSPIAGGFLSGAIKSKHDNPTEGRFKESPFQQFTRGRYFKDGIIEGAQLIANASEKAGLSPFEVAMRWLVHHSKLNVKNGDGVIIGFSNLDQLKDNLDYLEKPALPDDLVEVLEQAWKLAKGECALYFLEVPQYTYDAKQVLFGTK
ncbi:uncharacterized protein JN550_013666 [Neoarthrinium moseri]|uniref:uncharacterized protein n=1 Tax=Neoarthrinium moseri TaxID=1658444 RepID=UPI001FDE6F18|nr:uncharacterized protein JN550_013666 [Neoarthrinium moseri]KAI1856726.1 hypothetical protein JN550_013666 [Neoarthrinium moseri]